MKVEPSAGQPVGAAGIGGVRPPSEDAAGRVSAPRTPATQGDRVTLSAEAERLAALQSAAEAAPTGREERIQALKAAVQEGTYKPNLQALARRLARVISPK